MALQLQLTEEMKSALRAGDKLRLDVIRYLLAQIKNVEIDHGPQDDASIQRIIATQIKQSREAITDFERGHRADLVESEQAKIAVLQSYLPQQLSEAEVSAIIKTVITQHPDLGVGPLVGQVMQQVRGQAEGSLVSRLVQAELSHASS